MLADTGSPTVLAGAPAAVILADAGAPAVLAPVPLVVVLADAGAPAVAPTAMMMIPFICVMLADAGAHWQ